MNKAVVLLIVCCGATAARATTRAFTETYEARTGAEGDAQIESWVDDDHAFGNWDVWRLWWGGTASLTDSVEVSAYLVAAQQAEAGGGSSGLQLEMLYLMARWRFVGDGARGFSLMGQLQLCIPTLSAVADQAATEYLDHGTALGERLVASYDTDHFIAAANLLLDEVAVLQGNGSYDYGLVLKWTAGVAWAPWAGGPRGPPFTVGVEAFGDVGRPSSFAGHPYVGTWAIWWPGGFPAAVGPALSYARGRFWATASWGYAPGGAWSAPGVFASREGVGRLIVAFEF